MKTLVFLNQSPFKVISISTFVAATLMAAPLSLTAQPPVDHQMEPLKTTVESRQCNTQSITTHEHNEWGQGDAGIRKGGEVGGNGTGKRRFVKAGTEICCGRQDSVSIYLFNNQGDAIDVTGSYSYHEPIVVDAIGQTVGTVGANGNIYSSSSGQVIGYIAEDAN